MTARVLCIHGWGTSGEFMQVQLRNFAQFFPELKFEYITGHLQIPEEYNGADKSVAKLSPIKQYYTWKHNFVDEVIAGKEMDFTPAFKVLVDYINKNGPYDGLCGFSMGGCVAQLFVEFYEEGKFKDVLKVEGPKFVLLCSSNYYNRSTKVLKTASVHFAGDKDFLRDNAVLVTTKFLNPLVLRHCERHKFPKLSQYEIEAVKKYLAPFTRKNKAEVLRPKL